MADFLLLGILAVLFLLVLFLAKKILDLHRELEELQFSKSSQSVRYGKMSEQWIPFSGQVPFSPENFRFLGSPIDGVAFEDDRILFCEFKAGNSQLSEKQKRIREQVKQGRVEWLEVNAK